MLVQLIKKLEARTSTHAHTHTVEHTHVAYVHKKHEKNFQVGMHDLKIFCT